VDPLQELSFYSLLSLINLTATNPSCCQLISKQNGIPILLNLLRSPSFDAKKTVCLCLSQLLKGSPAIAQEVCDKGGVMVLVELINDEEDGGEDEERSSKAYQVSCLSGH
jgi:hypothetical protein